MQSQHFQGVTTIALPWDSALRVKLFVDIGVRIRKEGGEPVVRLCVRGSRPPVYDGCQSGGVPPPTKTKQSIKL